MSGLLLLLFIVLCFGFVYLINYMVYHESKKVMQYVNLEDEISRLKKSRDSYLTLYRKVAYVKDEQAFNDKMNELSIRKENTENSTYGYIHHIEDSIFFIENGEFYAVIPYWSVELIAQDRLNEFMDVISKLKKCDKQMIEMKNNKAVASYLKGRKSSFERRVMREGCRDDK